MKLEKNSVIDCRCLWRWRIKLDASYYTENHYDMKIDETFTMAGDNASYDLRLLLVLK
jgi:hypothetical protein